MQQQQILYLILYLKRQDNTMSKNYKWTVLSPDEIWEETSPKVRKNKKKCNIKKLKEQNYGNEKESRL